MDEDNFGNRQQHGAFLSKLAQQLNVHTPRPLNTAADELAQQQQHVTYERVNSYPSLAEIIFPVTLMVISLVGVLLISVILIFWLKRNSNKEDDEDEEDYIRSRAKLSVKMSKDLSSLEENLVQMTTTEETQPQQQDEAMMILNFKDRLGECNDLDNSFSDENHSPNIDKVPAKPTSSVMRKPLKSDGSSPKCFSKTLPDPCDSKKPWILHSAPPLDLKQDVCVQPTTYHQPKSPLRCVTPTIFRFDVKSVQTNCDTVETCRPSESNVFNYSMSSPLSSDNFYTPKTSFPEKPKKPREETCEQMNYYDPCGSPLATNTITTTNSTTSTRQNSMETTNDDESSTNDFSSGSRFNYSPKSCEYYSAKSTLKTPYEHFKFPELATADQTQTQLSSSSYLSTEIQKDSNIGVELQPATSDNLNIEASAIMHRRARLKSISLDSETACLVEAHLSVPMINLMKSHDSQESSYGVVNNNTLDTSYRQQKLADVTNSNPSKTTSNKPRNLNSLTLDLDYKDDTIVCDNTSIQHDEIPKTPKTPTLTQTKQKAISLDSSDAFTPLISLPKGHQMLQAHQQNSSVSVPNTPKRFTKKSMSSSSGHSNKQPHLVKSSYYSAMCNTDSLNIAPPGEYLSGSRSYNQKLTHYTRGKMGSFDENTMMMHDSEFLQATKQKSNDSTLLGTNLQHFKNTLSVSNNNLKTLPEVMSLSDFKIPMDNDEMTTTNTATSSTSGGAVKKSILQRRGSNQSLTLNLDSNFKSSYLSLQGSVSNLTNCRMLSASNYSLQGSSYNIYNCDNSKTSTMTGGKNKCLLQRRGSNNSLSLNLSQSGASNTMMMHRFNSQSSLSINQDVGRNSSRSRGLLERRNSNTSLTLNLAGHSGNLLGQREQCGAGAAMVHQDLIQAQQQQHHQSTTQLASNEALTATSPIHHHQIRSITNPATITTGMATYSRHNHRKSLSTESLFETPSASSGTGIHPNNLNDSECRCYGDPTQICAESSAPRLTFGSVDDLNYSEQYCNSCYADNSKYSCAQNGRHRPRKKQYVRNITTRPLSPQANSEDFKTYLANLQILQNATNVLCRQQLQDLNGVFQQGYSDSAKNFKKQRPHVLEDANASKANDECASAGSSNIDKFFTTTATNKLLTNRDGAAATDDSGGAGGEDETLRKSSQLLLHNLHKEFWNLPNNFQDKPIVFGSQGKNRYKSILPNEHSRVILDARSGANKEGYINANYIKGHDNTSNSFIATQGPLPNTIYDFWSMVHQNCKATVQRILKERPAELCRSDADSHDGTQDSLSVAQKAFRDRRTRRERLIRQRLGPQKIAMLTNLFESNHQKCAAYFPMECGDVLRFSEDSSPAAAASVAVAVAVDTAQSGVRGGESFDYVVSNVGVVHKHGYSLRKLRVDCCDAGDGIGSGIDFGVSDKTVMFGVNGTDFKGGSGDSSRGGVLERSVTTANALVKDFSDMNFNEMLIPNKNDRSSKAKGVSEDGDDLTKKDSIPTSAVCSTTNTADEQFSKCHVDTDNVTVSERFAKSEVSEVVNAPLRTLEDSKEQIKSNHQSDIQSDLVVTSRPFANTDDDDVSSDNLSLSEKPLNEKARNVIMTSVSKANVKSDATNSDGKDRIPASRTRTNKSDNSAAGPDKNSSSCETSSTGTRQDSLIDKVQSVRNSLTCDLIVKDDFSSDKTNIDSVVGFNLKNNIITDSPNEVRSISKSISSDVKNSLTVFHYWFEGWPDHKSPDDVNVLLDMCLHILDGDCEMDFANSQTATTISKNEIETGAEENHGDSQRQTTVQIKSIEKTSDIRSSVDVHNLKKSSLHDKNPSCSTAVTTSDVLACADECFQDNSLLYQQQRIAQVKSIENRTSDMNVVGARNHKKSLHDKNSSRSGAKTVTSDVITSADRSCNDLLYHPLPIVHCSAGIGRTGCLVAILNGVQQFRQTGRVDILGIVCNMRLSRGGMVQNSEQYELVHRVLCLYEQRYCRHDAMTNDGSDDSVGSGGANARFGSD